MDILSWISCSNVLRYAQSILSKNDKWGMLQAASAASKNIIGRDANYRNRALLPNRRQAISLYTYQHFCLANLPLSLLRARHRSTPGLWAQGNPSHPSIISPTLNYKRSREVCQRYETGKSRCDKISPIYQDCRFDGVYVANMPLQITKDQMLLNLLAQESKVSQTLI